MNPTVVADLVLLIGVPLCVLAVFLMWRAYRSDPTSTVLRRDLQVEFVVLLVGFVFGLIFRNNDTFPPPLDTDATKIITRYVIFGMLLISSLTFLWLHRSRNNR